MKNFERIEALCLIKDQLEQWASHMPEWYYHLHGCRDANIALQRVKQLLQHEIQMSAMEEAVEINQSLGLYNEM